MSDHDAPFACINVHIDRFQPRYKFIRNLKKLNEQDFINDFHALPRSIIYSSDDPDEQLGYFNNLFSECLENHAPLRRVRITRPPAPWMEESQICSLQQHNILRKEAHQTGTQELWVKFRHVRSKLKTAICRAREIFTRQALSSNKPKEVWQTRGISFSTNQCFCLHFRPKPIRMHKTLHHMKFVNKHMGLLQSFAASGFLGFCHEIDICS